MLLLRQQQNEAQRRRTKLQRKKTKRSGKMKEINMECVTVETSTKLVETKSGRKSEK